MHPCATDSSRYNAPRENADFDLALTNVAVTRCHLEAKNYPYSSGERAAPPRLAQNGLSVGVARSNLAIQSALIRP